MIISTDLTVTRQRACTHDVFVYRGLEYCDHKNSLGYVDQKFFDVYYCDHCLGIIAIQRPFDSLYKNLTKATPNNALYSLVEGRDT